MGWGELESNCVQQHLRPSGVSQQAVWAPDRYCLCFGENNANKEHKLLLLSVLGCLNHSAKVHTVPGRHSQIQASFRISQEEMA